MTLPGDSWVSLAEAITAVRLASLDGWTSPVYFPPFALPTQLPAFVNFSIAVVPAEPTSDMGVRKRKLDGDSEADADDLDPTQLVSIAHNDTTDFEDGGYEGSSPASPQEQSILQAMDIETAADARFADTLTSAKEESAQFDEMLRQLLES